MNPAEQRASRAYVFPPWLIAVICVGAVVQAWAFVENVREHEWALAVCFGLGTVTFVVQVVTLFWLRRRATRHRR